jgi:hypothetical protein
MKKLNRLFVLLAAATAMMPSCTKRLIPHPLEFCNISTITVAENGNPDTAFLHLSYDRLGRITSLASGSSTRTYTYTTDTNVVVRNGATTDSVTLNGSGLMTLNVNRVSGSTDYLDTYYYYSGTEVTSASLWYDGQFPGPGDYYSYNWDGGNLENWDPQAGLTSTGTYGYTYNSSPSATGDYFYVTQVLGTPWPVIKTTNQVATVQQYFKLSTVIYSNYPNGRISGMTVITTDITGQSAPDTVTYSYQYECQLFSLPPDQK